MIFLDIHLFQSHGFHLKGVSTKVAFEDGLTTPVRFISSMVMAGLCSNQVYLE